MTTLATISQLNKSPKYSIFQNLHFFPLDLRAKPDFFSKYLKYL